MITQYEVPGYLARLVPATLLQPKLGPINMTIYKDLRHFTDYTRQAVDEHNYALAKRCFRLAEKLYDHGDAIVKNAVENIFVFSFSSIIRAIKNRIFQLSREKYPNAKIFSITTGLAIMKMNAKLGFETVTFNELTHDPLFWEGCKSCINYDILQGKQCKNCLCTAMLYTPRRPAML